MNLTGKEHTFVICAYKESPYLEACILSLKKQAVKSSIIMVTSTDSPFLHTMAEKYRIPLFINDGDGGITQDWNFGLSKVNTPLATIAHQDDFYCRSYTKRVLEKEKSNKQAVRAL